MVAARRCARITRRRRHDRHRRRLQRCAAAPYHWRFARLRVSSMYDPIIAPGRGGAADEALDAARAAVAEQPQDPGAQRLLAMAQRLAGDTDAAIATLEHAITLAPEDPGLHLARAGLPRQARA